MMKVLPMNEMPDWLRTLDTSKFKETPLPLRELLTNSLYYPASGLDGDPVMRLAGNVHSFIYVDQGAANRTTLMAELARPRCFRGYELLAAREVTKAELIPNGWTPTLPTPEDGTPDQYRSEMKPPFALWAIMQRLPEFPTKHGPERFSLLYISGDGVATFQALYVENKVAPRYLSILQPGHGFGGNWTEFTDPARILARSVLNNPAGIPEYLLYGGWGLKHHYSKACWPGYELPIAFRRKWGKHFVLGYGGAIGIWQRT